MAIVEGYEPGGGGVHSLNGDVRPARVCFSGFFILNMVSILLFFCLNQRIGFINFCLKHGIFSWTINSLRVCSTNVLNRVSKIEILLAKIIDFCLKQGQG